VNKTCSSTGTEQRGLKSFKRRQVCKSWAACCCTVERVMVIVHDAQASVRGTVLVPKTILGTELAFSNPSALSAELRLQATETAR